MEIIENKYQLVQRRKKNSSFQLGFVPTMGALHKGHLALIKKSIEQCDKTMVSVFVNPLQFNQKEDFLNYPKHIENDLLLLENHGVDYVYVPSENGIGIQDTSVAIDFSPLDNSWEGQYRPNHFRGMGIIVSKLLNQIQPQRAYFGLKDYQQYMLINWMVKSLDFPLEVIGVETVRDNNGLAFSSRNELLSEQGKIGASKINKTLKEIKKQIKKGKSIHKILEKSRIQLSKTPNFKLDYLALVNQETLLEITSQSDIKESILIIAVYIENIRLIDNLKFDD